MERASFNVLCHVTNNILRVGPFPPSELSNSSEFVVFLTQHGIDLIHDFLSLTMESYLLYNQSEAEYQHQNPAERGVQDVKRHMNNVMDRTGCDAKWWLLAALFVIALMNHVPNSSGEVPLTMVTGQIQDISKFMHFHFWQEVFVESHKPDHKEELARWCFPADSIGDELTYMDTRPDAHARHPRLEWVQSQSRWVSPGYVHDPDSR